MRGRFITLEGGEGSGKSTQIRLLEQAFNKSNLKSLFTREPGGTKGAEILRGLLLEEQGMDWDAKAETLLFYAARLEHVGKVIAPAMIRGTHVVCDRFADSTFVYQGVGKGIDPEWIARLHRLTLGDLAPDLTIILDIDPAVGLARTQQRTHNETRFEQMDMMFHQKVRDGFLARAKESTPRYAVVDASQTQEAIHATILSLLRERLGLEFKEAA